MIMVSTRLFVLAIPHDNGKHAFICTCNWTENEQEWTCLQFISTAAVVKFIYVIYVELEFIVYLIGSGSLGGSAREQKVWLNR